nr:hypothetical protein [Micromonospora sp. DSM 115978]
MGAETTAVRDDLLHTIAEGKAVLLLGQRHTPGLVDQLIADIAALTDTPERETLPDQLQAVGSPSALDAALRGFRRPVPTEDLVGVLSCPWSLMLTTAVDPVVAEALSKAGGSSRQLRYVYPGQTQLLTPSRNPSSLTVMRLFGSVEESTLQYLPPLTRSSLRQRRLLEVPQAVRNVQYLVGDGALVVDGVGADDWMPLEILATACDLLPDKSVHWFLGENPVALEALEDFGGSIVTHDGTLQDFLRAAESDEAAEELRIAQETVIAPGAKTITIDLRSGKIHRIELAPQEWRAMSQVVEVLDDEVTATPPPLTVDQERAQFRMFLRGSQRPPNWVGVQRGFLFKRDVADDLRVK